MARRVAVIVGLDEGNILWEPVVRGLQHLGMGVVGGRGGGCGSGCGGCGGRGGW